MIAKQKSSYSYYRKTTTYLGARDKTIVAFVDLVGSTERWAYQPAIATFPIIQKFHNIVLQHAKKNDGKPIKGIGDEVMLRFDERDTSVACFNAIKTALGIQAALKNHPDLVTYGDNGKRGGKGLSCKIVIHYVKSGIRIGYDEHATMPTLVALKGVRANDVDRQTDIPEKYARDLVGHNVNVAARFTKIVRSGEILISKEAFQLLKLPAKRYLTKDKEINWMGPTVIYGFRGIEDNPVKIFSLGKRAATKAPQYPTQGIVRVNLKKGHDRGGAREILRAYMRDKEIQGRCAWSACLQESVLGDHLAFKIGEFDLDAFEDFVTKKFYSSESPGNSTLTTHTIFLRKDELPEKIKKMSSPQNGESQRSRTREIWLVRLQELEKNANQLRLEEWLSKTVPKKKVVLIDYMRTWGEFEAYLYVIASKSSDLDSFYDSFTHDCRDFAKTQTTETIRIKCGKGI